MTLQVSSYKSTLIWRNALVFALLVLAFGCQPSQPGGGNAGGGNPAVGNTGGGSVADKMGENAAAAPAQKVFPAQRANANVCKLGAKLRDNSDAQKMITGIPGALLDVKVGTIFEIQIPQAIQLYKAEHGRVPKNHAEFVARVLEPNQLKLPELVDGMVYQFNPEKEELWAYPKGELPAEK